MRETVKDAERGTDCAPGQERRRGGSDWSEPLHRGTRGRGRAGRSARAAAFLFFTDQSVPECRLFKGRATGKPLKFGSGQIKKEKQNRLNANAN